jgi:predicted phosphodiesterase
LQFAILADIHGNAPALSAVLEDAKKQGVDYFLLAGDYIFDLPFSNEVAACLQSLEHATIIAGNKEGYLPGLAAQDQNNWTHEQLGVIYETFRTLLPCHWEYLTCLPQDATVDLGFSRRAYMVHYIPAFHQGENKIHCGSSNFRRQMEQTPFTHEEFLTSMNEFLQGESIRAAVSQIEADVVIVGHSHLQWHGWCEGRLVLNPGSCGQPLDFAPGAPYSILHVTEQGFFVEERRVLYDIEETIAKAKRSSVYEAGRLWSKLVYLALRTGKDYFSECFAIAKQLADQKGEFGSLFANDTWRKAGELFFESCPDVRLPKKVVV